MKKLCTVQRLEDFVLAYHPLLLVRTMVYAALTRMLGCSRRGTAETKRGRPLIAPEKLAHAMLLHCSTASVPSGC